MVRAMLSIAVEYPEEVRPALEEIARAVAGDNVLHVPVAEITDMLESGDGDTVAIVGVELVD